MAKIYFTDEGRATAEPNKMFPFIEWLGGKWWLETGSSSKPFDDLFDAMESATGVHGKRDTLFECHTKVSRDLVVEALDDALSRLNRVHRCYMNRNSNE